jgi:hypothetical protein
MGMMTPIEILQEQLYKYEHALEKSEKSFKAGQITSNLHQIHKTNNEPKIKEFKQAIAILKAEEL